jgi:hypothetical protein
MYKKFTPRIADFLFIVLFISALISGPKMLNIDGDLPRHLLMGKVILETGNVPTQEIYSYVYENQPYTPHEWLADVIFYFFYVLLGLNGVVLLASALIAGTFGLLYSEGTSQNGQYVLTFLLMFLGAMVTSIHWVTRPHLFTMLFLAVWMILVEHLYRGRPVRVWVLPAVMLLWANIHAEFIAGFLVLIAYIAGCAWQYVFRKSPFAAKTGGRLIGVALLSFGASVFNPVGLRTWDIVVGYINNRYLISRIAETRPPDFSQPEYWPLLALLGIAIFLLISRRKAFAPAHFFLLIGFGVMSLLSARNAHLAGVVFPYVLSIGLTGVKGVRLLETIEAMFRQRQAASNQLMWYFIVPILISALILAGPLGKLNRFEPSIFPVDAVRWLEAHPQQGRMFNAFDWGGYILFHLWPEQKVFIESQTDVTGDATRKYETIVTLQAGWQKLFEQYNITWAILPPDWPLAQELIKQGWEIAHQDQTALILVNE